MNQNEGTPNPIGSADSRANEIPASPSSPPPLSGGAAPGFQDQEHLRLLSIFHYVCAGVAALFACFPIIHLILGIALLLNPRTFGPPNNQPPAFLGLFFIIFACVFILLGWTFAACVAYAGRCLGQRKKYTYCLVMAGVACMFVPFGTILGIFTIIVLVRPTVKALFTGHDSICLANGSQMKRSVRTLIQIIAAALFVFGALEIGLEIAHHKIQVRDHVTPIQTNVWRYLIGALLFVVGIILFLGANSLAEQLTDDIDDEPTDTTEE